MLSKRALFNGAPAKRISKCRTLAVQHDIGTLHDEKNEHNELPRLRNLPSPECHGCLYARSPPHVLLSPLRYSDSDLLAVLVPTLVTSIILVVPSGIRCETYVVVAAFVSYAHVDRLLLSWCRRDTG